ncbi:hypothetical protein [Candidatus Poriferisodalis sp.]|uniref:hypothetical protein n=1 Tax=Candidatus Poriferisodalis sp. TaxID=3101277 RepID=UPI003C6F3B5B
MTRVEDLLDGDLDSATALAAQQVPDVVAALDILMLRVTGHSDLAALRRYCAVADEAIRTLAGEGEFESAEHALGESSRLAVHLLRRDVAAVLWLAPTVDGIGCVRVIIDRLRGYVAGIPQQCVKVRDSIDPHRFDWTNKTLEHIELERRYSSPLRRAMAILNLSSSDIAAMTGVRRHTVDEWLLTGPPAERLDVIGSLAEIADILHYRLRTGTEPIAARRSTEAYEGRSMLDVIADGQHQWLLQEFRGSFDFNDIA